MSSLPQMHTMKEVAKCLHVTTRTLRRMVRSGKIPAYQIAGIGGPQHVGSARVLFKAEDVLALLDSARVAVPSRKHRCSSCQDPKTGVCPGCKQREYCDDGCKECKGQ